MLEKGTVLGTRLIYLFIFKLTFSLVLKYMLLFQFFNRILTLITLFSFRMQLRQLRIYVYYKNKINKSRFMLS